MSMPNIPDIKPDVSLSRDQAVNILLSSIGMEELSLAHMMNAEAEKIQYALGTLEGAKKNCPVSLDEIMCVNKSSAKVLRDIIKNQMLLSMKLEDVIELLPPYDNSFHNPPPAYYYPTYQCTPENCSICSCYNCPNNPHFKE